MKISARILIVILVLFILSCKENVTEIEPPSLSDVKILSPSGGEKLIGFEQDTIRWSNPETIESMGIYYTLDDGKKWITILYGEQIKSGYYVWSIPDVETNEAKIKLLIVAGTESYEVTSDSCFLIEKRGVKIIQPLGLEIYNVPGILNIKWKSNIEVEKYELYYSKFGKDIIDESWILIDKNIDPNASEYVWTLPSMYSNQVFLKIVGIYPDSGKIVAVSETNFAVYDKNVLEEEREYQEKFGLGNKWVYSFSADNVYYDDEEYYSKKEVVETKIDNGIKYYNVKVTSIKNDSIKSSSSYWVADRENYSPSFVMQDGDSYVLDPQVYTYGGAYSLKEYEENIFTIQQKIKSYNFADAYTRRTIKRAKDIGMYYYYDMDEGNLTTSNLRGAYIDGVVYGDTTVVGL